MSAIPSKLCCLVVVALGIVSLESVADCKDLPSLPNGLSFRGHKFSYNDNYLFAVHKGRICIKRKSPHAKWHRLSMLDEMKGTISELSVDGSRLIAKGKDGTIYFMKKGLRKPKHFVWTSNWGIPFGLGEGLALKRDITLWDFSYLSPKIDRSYVDSVGRTHTVGMGVSTIYAVRGDRQTITYYDPWLPVDESYGLCGPLRGRLKIAALSTIGSTLMVMDKYGNMFIRRYDFDIGAGNRITFRHTYERRKSRRGVIPWLLSARKLPVPDWVQLPTINGPITNKISIDRIGHGAHRRVMRVEGMHLGHSGYYETEYNFVDQRPDMSVYVAPVEWRFVRTDLPLEGTLVENPPEHGGYDLGTSNDQTYQAMRYDEDGSIINLELTDFNARCSPAALRVSFGASEIPMKLILHSTEKFRFDKREPIIGERPLELYGTIEIPRELLEHDGLLPEKHRQFLTKHFDWQPYTNVRLSITKDGVKLGGLKELESVSFALME